MKKLAMIVMLFGFVGSVHADGMSDEPMMFTHDDPVQGYSNQTDLGGALLKVEPEYDIKLDSDSPLCDTDPYSCFHLANEATIVRTPEESQQAFLIILFVFGAACAMGANCGG